MPTGKLSGPLRRVWHNRGTRLTESAIRPARFDPPAIAGLLLAFWAGGQPAARADDSTTAVTASPAPTVAAPADPALPATPAAESAAPPLAPPPPTAPATNAPPPDGGAPAPAASPASRDKAVAATSCELEPDDEFIGLDWTRRKTYEGICLSARWLDSLFGDDPYDLNAYPIEGFVGFDYEQRKDGSPTFKPRVRMRLKLPNLSKRLELFFERDDENKTIVGESDSAVTRQLGSGEQNTSQVGLGYEFMRGIDSLLNFRAGLRLVNGTIDPFVRSRYSLTFAKEARSEWRFGQSLFWRHIEGFGETTSLDYENRIGGPFIFRWNNSATVSQITEAFRWGSTASILHPLDDIRTLLYSYSAGGDTGTAVPLASYGPRVSYRQQLHRRWLFGEVYVGDNYVKSDAGVERKQVPYIGAKIEAHFKTR